MGTIWMPGGGGGADVDVVTATGADVMEGKVIVGPDGEPLTGAIVDRGTPNVMLNCGEAFAVQAGRYNAGKITANSLASQTPGTATAAHILSGQTAWVNGAKVSGNIPSKGAAAYTPGTSTQIIEAGQYLSGRQTINPIPSNYYNANNMQTVFSYGSYGVAASLGAYYANITSSGYAARQNEPVTVSNRGGLQWSASINTSESIIFRAAFPPSLQYVRMVVGAIYSSLDMMIRVVNPATMSTIAQYNTTLTTDTTVTPKIITANFSGVISNLNTNWFLVIVAYRSSGEYGIYEVQLSPTAF